MTAASRSHEDPLKALSGLRPAQRAAFARMGVETLGDLLRLAPRRYEDRRHPRPIAGLEAGETVLVVGHVRSSRAVRTRSGISILEACVEDESGTALARWFYRGFKPTPLPEGRRVALYGVVKIVRKERPEFAGPELERLAAEGVAEPGCGRYVPVHPCTTGLSAPVVRRAMWQALSAADDMPDSVPATVCAAYDLPALGMALRTLHFPDDLAEAERARRRLAFDELLVHELLLLERRAARCALAAPPVPFPARVRERIDARLPFQLTAGQRKVVAEITADLERGVPMYRLLQGDVGSGKTAVAVYALLGVVASGRQVAFMAPTDVLARQHVRTLEAMLEGSRVRLAALSGGRRGKARSEALTRIAAGDVDVVIGTHAVLGRDVVFADLGLVIVDEQHKFGVRQRRALLAKGGSGSSPAHCLVMTATPIPRTLALTVWGDMDVSIITGCLPGRTPVETWVVRPGEARRVMARVKQELAAGRQAYVIYPLVEESEKLALKDAQAGHARWTKALPGRRVGLLHGRLKREEKQQVMETFAGGGLDVLVATVVVEVGVDVPNATVLIVEHAERFGLSQLHQLRGRIGRGSAGGICVLVDRSRAGRPARLDVLAAGSDGFVIAEEDLKLRGVGDLFGTRQHGRPGFHAASLPRDLPVLLEAREAAAHLGSQDPGLARHPLLRHAMQVRKRLLESDPSAG